MQTITLKSVLFCVLLLNTLVPSSSKKMKSNEAKTISKDIDNVECSALDFSITCQSNNRASATSPVKTKLIPLVDIESTDSNINSVVSRKNKNLFFVESSGRNYLTTRDACTIESAVKNSGFAGYIIVAMTSGFLDVTSNNATCRIYTEHAGTNVFFRHVNVDTIFKDTPIHRLHLDGHLKYREKKLEIVQYRYK